MGGNVNILTWEDCVPSRLAVIRGPPRFDGSAFPVCGPTPGDVAIIHYGRPKLK